MNLLARLFRVSQAKALPCPRCKSLGSEPRGPMVVPYDDGTEREVGKLYGCPHCGLAWFIHDGTVRLFGHLKGTMSLHPSNWTPADVNRDERERPPAPDSDMRWR